MAEIEARFLIEDSSQIGQLFDLLRLQGLDVEAPTAADTLDRYFDTPDWQVYRAGWAYWWRDTAGERRTVGLSSVTRQNGVVHSRCEAEQQVDRLPSKGHRFARGPVARQLRAVAQEELRQLFQVHRNRRSFQVRGPDAAWIEVTVDKLNITTAKDRSDKRAASGMEFHELVLELKEGPAESLRQIAGVVECQLALLPARVSEFERGLQATGLAPPAAGVSQQLLEQSSCLRSLSKRSIHPREPVSLLVYRYLLDQFDQMLCEEPKAWEGVDPEGVHQMRVATRRMRAVLRAFKKLFKQTPIVTLNEDLKWLAAELGRVRDLDVYRENLRHYMIEIPAEDAACLGAYQVHLVQQRRQARQQLLSALRSERYAQFKERFREFLRNGPECGTAAKVPSVKRAARRYIGRSYQRVLRKGRAIDGNSHDDAIHALRIECKRLRYLFEFFRSVYGSALTPNIKRLKKLQDALGEFQDACVGTAKLRAYADEVPAGEENRDQLLALGQLIHSQRKQAKDCQAGFCQRWRRFDRAGQRKRILAHF